MRPLCVLASFGIVRRGLSRAYRLVAAHRACTGIACARACDRNWGTLAAFAPPLVAVCTARLLVPWAFMWLMAGALFLAFKWLTFVRARKRTRDITLRRALAWFFLWPGMDAGEFFQATTTATAITQRRKHRARVSFATAKILSGAVLLFGIARFASGDLLKAWVGMIATVLILHFGIFDLVACGWRRAGFDFRPIMNRPITSRSLTEFWGRRWNGAFNQLVLDRRLDFHHGDRGRSGVLGFSPRLRSARHSAVHESHRRAMKTLLQIAALAQLAILVASALVPRTLDWRGNLAQLHPFLRRLFWVYGSFIVLTIIAFAALTFLHAGAIATRDPVARSLCAFIAIFWAARLFVQLAVFDARPFLTNAFYKIGYHALTIAFAFLILVYASAAL